MNPTQEVIEKLKVLRLDLSEDIGDWSHSIMAIEAALALLQPVATPAGPSTLDEVPRYELVDDLQYLDTNRKMEVSDCGEWCKVADITALVRRLEDENRKLRAKFDHWSGTDVPSLNIALALAREEVARLTAENAALKKELGR